MSEVYTYDANPLTTVRDGSVEFTQVAQLGRMGSGRIAIDDTAGTLSIVGQKDFSHTESACSFPLTFRGFIDGRTYGRDAGIKRAPHVGAARGIGVSLLDLNAMLGFVGLTGADANRPAETVNARMAWLLAHPRVSPLFGDGGRIASVTTQMDQADYRQQFPDTVLADMVMAAEGFNHYIADWGSGPELVFRNDNTSTADSSTLRISNVLADASGVTVYPFKDAELRRDPSVVKSRLSYNYARGTYANSRAATATAFNGERYMAVSNSNVKTEAKAVSQVLSMLEQLSTEDDEIECTVQLTSTQVNLIRHGMRVQAKFSHFATEGYGAFTWFRVLERTVTPLGVDAALYNVRLKLSPQEPAAVAEICVDVYDATPSGSYFPLGGDNGAPGGPTPNVSDGVVFYWRAGLEYPGPLDAGLQGGWHFGLYQAGGAGTVDYAGDCAQNRLIFVTVGAGEWVILTEQYAGVRKTLNVRYAGDVVATWSSGDAITITIDDVTDGDCVRVYEITDDGISCNGKWGFAGAEWTAA